MVSQDAETGTQSNVRTQSEMLEDARRDRRNWLDPCQTPKAAVDPALSDRFQKPVVINAGTVVYVTDKSRNMIPHTLKKDHVFLTHLIGSTPELGTLSNAPKIPSITTPERLLKSDYYTFETNNRDWPYMVVQRDKIRNEGITGVSTDYMMMDEFGNVDDSA